jgi:hypothetical protein
MAHNPQPLGSQAHIPLPPPFEQAMEFLYAVRGADTDTVDKKREAKAKELILTKLEATRTVEDVRALLEQPRTVADKDEATLIVEACLASEDKIR